MKPTLQLKIGQHLTMTPQLQQAIRLLQLSALDLQGEIQEMLDSNPMLETEETELDGSPSTPSEGPDMQQPADKVEAQNDAAPEDASLLSSDALRQDEVRDESPLDSHNEMWEASMTPMSGRRDADQEAEYFGSNTETLLDHLLWQMNLTRFSEVDQSIALSIIDGIDDDGYLTLSLEEIADAVSTQDLLIELDEVEAVLHRIQQFDPLGVGARDLKECLSVQLSPFDAQDQTVLDARCLVETHITLLGQKNYRQIVKISGISEERIAAALSLITSLNPRPGSTISTEPDQYLIPDIFVRKHQGSWQVQLNPEAAPRIRINQGYANMIRQVSSSADSKFMKGHLQEARWFLKSLQSRSETLLKVSRKIVDAQQNFFDYGEEAMRPMVLSDIAEAVEMHESTISRVTTQKYLYSPRGVFELKYFFSSHVSTSSGGECSSTAIRALLRKLINAENHTKPLSDSKLANVLKEQGIMVARRTVAKYRESMNIPSSTERRTLF